MGNDNYKVYMHTTPNGKRYIGITCRNVSKRWRNGDGYKTQRVFYRAISKYGWVNISHEVLHTGLSENAAKDKEKELIARYNATDSQFGYNVTAGGDGMSGYTCTEEHRENLRESHLGQKWTDESRKKLSESLKGHPSYTLGMKFNEGTRRKISEALKGRPVSEETRRRISEAQKGKALSEEHYQNLCKAMKNEETRHKMSEAQKGRKISEETRRKISETRNRKPVAQFDKEMNFIADYPSICDAAKAIDGSKAHIAKCCTGQYKSAYGYIWREAG